MSGDILGLKTTAIDFQYNPQSLTTAEAQIVVKTSEFDAESKTIRIVGNAAPVTGPSKVNLQNTMDERDVTGMHTIYEEDQNRNDRFNQPKTLLRDRSRKGTGSIRLDKLPSG
jgi:hypothetical protein